jgi:hypothetical protein
MKTDSWTSNPKPNIISFVDSHINVLVSSVEGKLIFQDPGGDLMRLRVVKEIIQSRATYPVLEVSHSAQRNLSSL